MTTPKVTYVVSAYNRPLFLRCALASIQVQSSADWEVYVADNGSESNQLLHQEIIAQFGDPRIVHVNTAQYAYLSPGFDCYHSAEWIVANMPCGEWLCFPSDDSYFVPIFQKTMIDKATENGWDLVYSDMLYDRRGHGKYHHKVAAARCCEIDKTCFMLRRDKWIGFPTKPTDQPRASNCDGEMIEELVRRGISHGRVDEPMCVHN